MYQEVFDLDDAGRTVFQYNYGAIDLAAQLGGTTAWMGFSAATGGANERVDIKVLYEAPPVPADLSP